MLVSPSKGQSWTVYFWPNLTLSLIMTNANLESWCWFISHDNMAPCSFETILSSFLFQLYGTTFMAPYCKGMLKKEMVSMLSVVPSLILIMTDIMIPWRLWNSKNVFHLLLKTALKWDYHPAESAEPFLSDTVHIYVHDISDYAGSPLKYLINFDVLLSVKYFLDESSVYRPLSSDE